VAKANEALTHMAAKLQQGPAEPRAVGAKKLNNGGIVYNLDKLETASWVRREKNAFMARFGGTAVVRDRATSVIVEFVPVEHSPDALAKNRRIECDSGLDKASLNIHQVDQTASKMCTGSEGCTLDSMLQDKQGSE